MKVTKKKLISIADALNSIKSENKMLTYAIIKNQRLIESEVMALNESQNFDTPAYHEYVGKIREVVAKYGKKDENGNIIPTPTGFMTEDGFNPEEVQDAINIINEEYNSILEDRSSQISKYNMMLEDIIEYDFIPLKLYDLPDSVSDEAMKNLFDLIVE